MYHFPSPTRFTMSSEEKKMGIFATPLELGNSKARPGGHFLVGTVSQFAHRLFFVFLIVVQDI